MENRTRITPYLLAIFSAILVLSFGCKDDFFKETAGDRITPDQHYQSLIDANVSLQGAIIPLQDAMPKLILLDGLRSDMMEVTPNADSYLRELNYQMISSSNPITDPSDLYKVIVNVNEVLANIDQVAEKDRDFDALTAYSYKGALIGMRAWTYLTLARLYNKVAYIDDNLTSLPENLSQKVLTKEAILDTLINQLETYFKSEYTTNKYQEIRIQHYVNNKALLGELYLEVGRYAEAAAYLKLACESYNNTAAMLKVDKSYQNAAWGTLFLNSDGTNHNENIAVIPFSRAEDQFNPFADWFGHNRQYLVKPSTLLVDSFIAQVDATGAQGDLYRGAITFGANILEWTSDTTYTYEAYITKYAVDVEDPLSSDIIISRAADIHLLLAEAYNRMGDATSQKYALMLLNQGVNKENPKPAPFSRWSANLGVRGRVYLKSREVPKNMMDADSITTLIEDFIIAERALELAFEGKRWTDLVRIAERRNDPAYLADRVAAKFAGTSDYDAIRNKLMNPANWYLPFE